MGAELGDWTNMAAWHWLPSGDAIEVQSVLRSLMVRGASGIILWADQPEGFHKAAQHALTRADASIRVP